MSEIPLAPPDKPILLNATQAVCDVVRELGRQHAHPLPAAVAGQLLQSVVLRHARRGLGWSRADLVRAAALLLFAIELLDEGRDPDADPDAVAKTRPNPYRDDSFPERDCDHCGKPYRGPAVYCSLDCAVSDA
jgi:hypothetical protein